jgi:hypothetical protein
VLFANIDKIGDLKASGAGVEVSLARKTETAVDEITELAGQIGHVETRIQGLVADLDTKTTDLVGHITGGESYPCLMVDPDRGLLVLVRGKHSIRELRVDFADAAAASPTLTPTETFEIPYIAAETGRKYPIKAFDKIRQGSDDGRLYIKFSALNGIMHQFLDFRKKDSGSWVFATRVMAHGDKVERVDPGFGPPPDWDSEMRRLNITLERRGQVNLAPLPSRLTAW